MATRLMVLALVASLFGCNSGGEVQNVRDSSGGTGWNPYEKRPPPLALVEAVRRAVGPERADAEAHDEWSVEPPVLEIEPRPSQHCGGCAADGHRFVDAHRGIWNLATRSGVELVGLPFGKLEAVGWSTDARRVHLVARQEHTDELVTFDAERGGRLGGLSVPMPKREPGGNDHFQPSVHWYVLPSAGLVARTHGASVAAFDLSGFQQVLGIERACARGWVNDVRASPDGAWIAISSLDGVRVYSKRGQLRSERTSRAALDSRAVFWPDPERVATVAPHDRSPVTYREVSHLDGSVALSEQPITALGRLMDVSPRGHLAFLDGTTVDRDGRPLGKAQPLGFRACWLGDQVLLRYDGRLLRPSDGAQVRLAVAGNELVAYTETGLYDASPAALARPGVDVLVQGEGRKPPLSGPARRRRGLLHAMLRGEPL